MLRRPARVHFLLQAPAAGASSGLQPVPAVQPLKGGPAIELTCSGRASEASKASGAALLQYYLGSLHLPVATVSVLSMYSVFVSPRHRIQTVLHQTSHFHPPPSCSPLYLYTSLPRRLSYIRSTPTPRPRSTWLPLPGIALFIAISTTIVSMPSTSTLHASCLAPSAPADTPTPPHVLPRYTRLDSSPPWHPHPRAATGAISTTLSVPLHPCTFDGPVLLVGVGDHTSTCSCVRLQTWTNASSPAHSYQVPGWLQCFQLSRW